MIIPYQIQELETNMSLKKSIAVVVVDNTNQQQQQGGVKVVATYST